MNRQNFTMVNTIADFHSSFWYKMDSEELISIQRRQLQRWPSQHRVLVLRVVVCWFLSTAALASVPTDIADSSITNEKICFSHGCPNYPRDVMLDEIASDALDILSETADQNKDALEAKRALQELESCGNSNQVTMTMIGDKGEPENERVNQDRSFVLSPFRLRNVSLPNARLLGVFDGHSKRGEIVSQYAVEQVPSRLSEKLELYLTKKVLDDPDMIDKEVVRALNETFVEIERDLPAPTKYEGGCTASVALQLGRKIYIANAGDSQTFVVAHLRTSGETKIVYVSREDKPDLPDERARIEAMGGKVNIPEDDEDSPRAMMVDPKTGWWYGVAMSRSIGDCDIKGVIPDPVVDVLDIDEIIVSILEEESTCEAAVVDGKAAAVSDTCSPTSETDVEIFAVSATDGMMDFVPRKTIAKVFANAFYSKDAAVHPLTASRDLIMQAAKAWRDEYDGTYRDDIAVAACKLTFASR